MERTPAIQRQASLPKVLWAEDIYFAVWLKICTSTKALESVAPYERDFIERPNIANAPEWGQQVWVYNTSGAKSDAVEVEVTVEPQARWARYDANIFSSQNFHFSRT